MLKVGLAGIGGISNKHIEAWNEFEETELVAICDNRPECANVCPGVRFYQDYNEMLEKEELDIVDICVPTFLHREFSIKALDRGIHVICEKPLALKADDVTAMYAAAKRNNVKFMSTQPLHFMPGYEYLKNAIDTQKYGRLISGTMLRLSAKPASSGNWMANEKLSGLVAYDMHIHDLDFLVYALGKPTEATGRRSRLPEQDVFHATYVFGDVFVHCEGSWYAARFPWTQEYRFQFEKAVVTGSQGWVTVYTDTGKVISSKKELCNTDEVIELTDDDGYHGELRYFCDCVYYGRPVEKVTEEEIHTVIETLNTVAPLD